MFTSIAAILLAGCTISGENDTDSPYESATLTLSSAVGLADGLSEIVATVEGLPNSQLIIEVEGADASFVLSDQIGPQKKTVFLSDVDGDGVGTATASIIAKMTGTAEVRLEGDPVRTAQTATFARVRIAAGGLTPVRYDKGRVVHDLCIGVNTPDGLLVADGVTVESLFAPNQADIQDIAPAGLDCPTLAVDAFGWRGFGRFTWSTAIPNAELVISFVDELGEPLVSAQLPMVGLAFPGYEVTSEDPVFNGTLTSVTVGFEYAAAGELDAAPAAGVTLSLPRFLPADGSPEFIGSTSGGESDDPVTDQNGEVTLFFDTESSFGTFAMFATPENGSAVYVTDIDIP